MVDDVYGECYCGYADCEVVHGVDDLFYFMCVHGHV